MQFCHALLKQILHSDDICLTIVTIVTVVVVMVW